MSDEIKFESKIGSRTANAAGSKFLLKNVARFPTEGKIAETIGRGENAKNSFIWVTIRWSFLIGALTSLAIYMRPLYCQADLQGNLIEDIKSVWSLFMPVITLALGYTFGKGR